MASKQKSLYNNYDLAKIIYAFATPQSFPIKLQNKDWPMFYIKWINSKDSTDPFLKNRNSLYNHSSLRSFNPLNNSTYHCSKEDLNQTVKYLMRKNNSLMEKNEELMEGKKPSFRNTI